MKNMLFLEHANVDYVSLSGRCLPKRCDHGSFKNNLQIRTLHLGYKEGKKNLKNYFSLVVIVLIILDGLKFSGILSKLSHTLKDFDKVF